MSAPEPEDLQDLVDHTHYQTSCDHSSLPSDWGCPSVTVGGRVGSVWEPLQTPRPLIRRRHFSRLKNASSLPAPPDRPLSPPDYLPIPPGRLPSPAGQPLSPTSRLFPAPRPITSPRVVDEALPPSRSIVAEPPGAAVNVRHRTPPTNGLNGSPVAVGNGSSSTQMTFAPFINNNHIYVYMKTDQSDAAQKGNSKSPSPVKFEVPSPSPPPPLTPSHPHRNHLMSPSNHFPNMDAIRSFRIPKKRHEALSTPPPPSPPSQPHFQVLHTSPPPSQPHFQVLHSSLSPPPSRPHNAPSEEAVSNSVCVRRQQADLATTPYALTFTLSSSDGHSWTDSSLEGEWRGGGVVLLGS